MGKSDKEFTKLAFAEYHKFNLEEDPNGIEVIGVIFDKKSKLYLFDPKGEKFKVGDVVEIRNYQDILRKVAVVVPNIKVSESRIQKPFRPIENVVLRATYDVNQSNVSKDYSYDNLILKDSKNNTFKVRKINDNKVNSTNEINKLIRVNEKTINKEKNFIKQLKNIGSVKFIDSRTGKTVEKEVKNQEELTKYLEYIVNNKNLEIQIG